jgi:CPA1 family monovalent cation:H+ antiporter
VQIALGAFITFLPLGFQLKLDTNLFFVLFVAPIIYYVSMIADVKTMWAQRKPILNMGILLVFATIIATGYLLNFLVPSIPLVAAFVLIAALGPTDDVAVAAIGKRVNVPPKIMNIIQGESIINDASGIVSFQFALAAMLTGSFSIIHATGRFFIVALGGMAVGFMLAWLKYQLVKWLRALGMESVSLHLTLGILTPFVVYLIAEAFGVSGILAVFAAGLTHSFSKDKFNPEKIHHNIASESVWSIIIFTLEGLVFVILGTQLPKILASIHHNSFSITSGEIVACIFLITLLFLISRFVWSLVVVKKKTYEDSKHRISRLRASVIFSLSGARGAVTLASVLSIPLVMNNGVDFPERDLIILIAGGVIVISLLITSFILPLCVEKKTMINKPAENKAYLEILQHVIAELKKEITPENETATAIIIANYHSRSADLKRKHIYRHVNRKEERKLRKEVCEWEKENITGMLERGETDENAAQYYLNMLDAVVLGSTRTGLVRRKNIIRFLHHNQWVKGRKYRASLRTKVFALMETNTRLVLEKLKELRLLEDNPVIREIAAEYELRLSLYQRGFRRSKPSSDMLVAVASHAFQTERDHIQKMLELGRISKETVKEMRHNISLLELQLKNDYF